jgi:hypothetical protein
VDESVEAAGKAVWDKKAGSQVLIEVGAKYTADKDASIKVCPECSFSSALHYSLQYND